MHPIKEKDQKINNDIRTTDILRLQNSQRSRRGEKVEEDHYKQQMKCLIFFHLSFYTMKLSLQIKTIPRQLIFKGSITFSSPTARRDKGILHHLSCTKFRGL
jgi:hypothetical protein